MLTSFTRDDAMRANELSHHVELPINNALASLIVNELKAPSFRRPDVCAWYARAHLGAMVVPFMLRWDANGNAVIVVSFHRLDELRECLVNLVPATIEILELPRGRENRSVRAA